MKNVLTFSAIVNILLMLALFLQMDINSDLKRNSEKFLAQVEDLNKKLAHKELLTKFDSCDKVEISFDKITWLTLEEATGKDLQRAYWLKDLFRKVDLSSGMSKEDFEKLKFLLSTPYARGFDKNKKEVVTVSFQNI